MTHGGSRPGAGRKPAAGTTRLHPIRFLVAEHELAEILAVVPDGQLSDWCRDALLERVRR